MVDWKSVSFFAEGNCREFSLQSSHNAGKCFLPSDQLLHVPSYLFLSSYSNFIIRLII